MTGRPLNKFKQAVNEADLERAPSFRDWQVNRLQQHGTAGTANQTKKTKDYSRGKVNHTVEINRVSNNNSDSKPYNMTNHQAPITYVPGANRVHEPSTARQKTPYSITTQSGRSDYEVRSHLDQVPSNSSHQTSSYYGRQPKQYGSNQPPPGYDSYLQNSSAVQPNQLRTALEEVALSTSTGAANFQAGAGHNTSADTVV